MRPLIATYRLQLRQGVDFDRAIALLPYIAGLGVSHVYLSPIFTAESGSTHGYDVADPAEIDPVLGGRAGYERFARVAHRHQLGIILDLVPNHTVLSVENPWLLDALTHGADSRFARYFDIDWQQGLILPILPEPLDEMLAAGSFEIDPEAARVSWEGGWLPLAPGTAEAGEVAAIFDRQHWHLRHWVRERRRLSHRRFFNITSLIGMRVEERAVFDAMMALPLELVREGLADGLRIDHIDGLADPAGYLGWLRDELGTDVPVWVEKILTGDEAMPAWPIEGTTGYEANDRITRLLLDEDGMERLDGMWRGATGTHHDYEEACCAARHQILSEDLAAELGEMTRRGVTALEEAGRPSDPDTVREALRAMLVAFPRYRSYIDADGPSGEDAALLDTMVCDAAAGLSDRTVLDHLHAVLLEPAGPEGRGLVRRFQQVTGAVVAKAQEDTAFYRQTRCLAEAEVGSEPDAPPLSPEAFEAWSAERLTQWPDAMTLGSSHDTKRAEDARARLIALTHLPDSAAALWQQAEALDAPHPPDDSSRWYILQSALALWEPQRDDLEERLSAHLQKALREAKELTDWHVPDEEAEAQAAAFATALLADWRRAEPAALRDLVALGERLSLVQLALRCMVPGVPDIYQGSETGTFALTDPDNRAPLDPAAPVSAFGARKMALLDDLLTLRRQHRDVFARGECRIERDGSALRLVRSLSGREVALRFTTDAATLPKLEAPRI
ncbi:malto-oligosyltrehalose synthase [Salipiger bermudensis]|uniref:malto-oligosyltrehalose synthase n=1 Tax=Salipiger bermudensis TaxID=344736 RepID=UPI001C9908BC|nr:malto-oligosyltrehalose synthase [Salipiger bermudensis]MBY6005069.1 malto-oligosyltrehalose synthase [Salipiger bermudensis]